MNMNVIIRSNVYLHVHSCGYNFVFYLMLELLELLILYANYVMINVRFHLTQVLMLLLMLVLFLMSLVQ